MIMRTCLAAFVVLASSAVSAGAQQVPQCSTDSSHFHLLSRLASELAEEGPTASAAVTRASILEDNAACAHLRHSVRVVVARYPQGISLASADWTFFDLGDRYAVLLSGRRDPSDDLVVSGRSPLFIFTKEVRPRLLSTLYL